MTRGTYAESEETMVRYVICEFSEQRRTELYILCFLRYQTYYCDLLLEGEKKGGNVTQTHLVAKTCVTASDTIFVAWTYGQPHMSVESRSA